MVELNKYLEGNNIKADLSKEQLLELKECIEKMDKGTYYSQRSKDCYLLEIEFRLKEK